MRIIVEKTDRFLIQFSYDRKINAAVQKLPLVSYDAKYKYWEIPRQFEDVVHMFAQKYGFEMSGQISQRRVWDTPSEMPKLTVDIPLKLTPYDYQKAGIAYGLQHGSCINGDAPGLGKTGQSIATVVAKNLFPCLIICPASLKYNWEQEWNLWTDHRPAILTDTIKHTWDVFYKMGTFDVFIVNYESLKKYFVVKVDKPESGNVMLKHVHFHPNINLFKSVIVDESHRVKEASTMQTKLTAGICKGKDVQLLSGTPIQNKPIDLLTQITIIGKMSEFGGSTNFKEMCADNERWPEINSILRKSCYFRREKKDVLKDLPDKYRQKVLCDITNQEEYNAAMADLESYLREFRQATEPQIQKSLKGKVMVQIGVLKNISARGKLQSAIEYINDVIESGEKIVVFIYLSEIADILRSYYPKALFFTGVESPEQRNDAIQKFQGCAICGTRFERHTDDDHYFEPSEHNVIFVNYKAGGVGITLTAASRVAFLELPWHSADTDQCEDRCHRISQKNAVQATYFLGRNTIDESIYQVISDKREMSNTCTGAVDNTEESTLESIIGLLK